MDYQKHYDLLMERARDRKLDCYIERHHIVPRCLGGTDEPENIVELTPEEHYLAHQLLVKIHPGHKGLIWAAIMMTGQSAHQRSGNKLYGWLKRKQSSVAKRRTGKRNGSFGRSWYYDPITKKNGKFLDDEIPDGWVKGRWYPKNPDTQCENCGKATGNDIRKFCKPCRKKKATEHLKAFSEESTKYENWGRRKASNEDIRLALIDYNYCVDSAMESLGYKPQSGYTRYRFQNIRDNIIPS